MVSLEMCRVAQATACCRRARDARRTLTGPIPFAKEGVVVKWSYIQSLDTVHGATVEKQPKSVFFVRREIIFVTDQSGVTTISIIVPIDDPAPRGVIYFADSGVVFWARSRRQVAVRPPGDQRERKTKSAVLRAGLFESGPR